MCPSVSGEGSTEKHTKWANVLSAFVFYLNISPIFKFLSFFISFNVVFLYIDLKCLHFYVKNCY